MAVEKDTTKDYRMVLAIVIPILLFAGLYCYKKGMFSCDKKTCDKKIEKPAGSDSGEEAAKPLSDAAPAAVVAPETPADDEIDENSGPDDLKQSEAPEEEVEEKTPSTDAPKPPTNQGRLRLMRE